jgi:hypothetical protein
VAPRSAYEIARAGGRHAGLLRTYQTKSTAEIQRALRSYERQVALHRQKLQSPEQFIQEWDQKSPRVQEALLRHWQERAFGPAPTPAPRNGLAPRSGTRPSSQQADGPTVRDLRDWLGELGS